MYPWITHTWNTIKGKCPHSCSYCFMNQDRLNPIRFDKKELGTDLGQDNFIFVGSSCDMWAERINYGWIIDTLSHCCQYDNRYLFQSKNPARFIHYKSKLPPKSLLGTTIETNRFYKDIMGKSLPPHERSEWLYYAGKDNDIDTMVTIEPIMRFDLIRMTELIQGVSPKWINIGADSKGHNLPEPKPEKILDLIEALKEFTEVKLKPNLNRLIGNHSAYHPI